MKNLMDYVKDMKIDIMRKIVDVIKTMTKYVKNVVVIIILGKNMNYYVERMTVNKES